MPSKPRTALLLRGKNVSRLAYTAPLEDNRAIVCAPVETRAEFSPDGRFLAVVETEGLRLLDAESGAQLMSEPRPGVQARWPECRIRLPALKSFASVAARRFLFRRAGATF